MALAVQFLLELIQGYFVFQTDDRLGLIQLHLGLDDPRGRTKGFLHLLDTTRTMHPLYCIGFRNHKNFVSAKLEQLEAGNLISFE